MCGFLDRQWSHEQADHVAGIAEPHKIYDTRSSVLSQLLCKTTSRIEHCTVRPSKSAASARDSTTVLCVAYVPDRLPIIA